MAGGLGCTVKCAAGCLPICAADTVSPVADVLGVATSEAKFWTMK